MMKRWFYILTSMALLVACNKDDDNNTSQSTTGNDKRVSLEIAANIGIQAEGTTRAAETHWDEGDQIGVYVTKRNTTTIFEDVEHTVGKNLLYTFNDGTNYETNGSTYRLFAPSKKIYLSSDPVDIFGYYPYNASASLDPTAIPINVSDQSSQERIDFMRGKRGNVSNSNVSIELQFKHKLVKLVFNLKQGEGLLPDELNDATYLGMKIDKQPYEATYNAYTDVLSVTLVHNEIIPVRATTTTGFVRTFEAIVLPNTSSGETTVAGNPSDDRTVTINFYRRSDDAIVNTFKIPSSTYFYPGYKYIYNVTVNATSIEVDPQKYTEQW